MAKPSTGTIPPEQPIIDVNNAMAVLSTLYNWKITKVNEYKANGAPGVRVDIRHAGRRVSATRADLHLAVKAAMAKLREPSKKRTVKTVKPVPTGHVLKLAGDPHPIDKDKNDED